MTFVSELVIDDRERLVTTAEPIAVGDALIVEDEILLVLRETEVEAVRAQARFQCRRALALQGRAHELLAYSKELRLKLTEAREIRARS
jgi:hypothetical protein